MPISDYANDYTPYRDKFYTALRALFIDDGGDSTFATDDASVESTTSAFQAILWGAATILGIRQEEIERAGQNRSPNTAKELLGMLEHDFQVVPPFDATIAERQATLALRARVARGASRTEIEAALTQILGDDFVSYETIDDVADLITWPDSPGDVGVFDVPTAERKIFRLLGPVDTIGVAKLVAYEAVGDSNHPLAGETYCIDPDTRFATEKITILSTEIAAIDDDVLEYRLTAEFAHAHEPGTLGCRPHPVWISNQRYNKVVVSLAAATSNALRHRVNDYLARALRGVSQWGIGSDEGSFALGDADRGILGATFLGDVAGADTVTHSSTGFIGGTSSVGAVGAFQTAGAAAGAIAGTGAASGVSSKIAAAVGAITGTGTATAVSSATKRAAGAIAGTSVINGRGAP